MTWTDRSILDCLAKGLSPKFLLGSHEEHCRSDPSQNKQTHQKQKVNPSITIVKPQTTTDPHYVSGVRSGAESRRCKSSELNEITPTRAHTSRH